MQLEYSFQNNPARQSDNYYPSTGNRLDLAKDTKAAFNSALVNQLSSSTARTNRNVGYITSAGSKAVSALGTLLGMYAEMPLSGGATVDYETRTMSIGNDRVAARSLLDNGIFNLVGPSISKVDPDSGSYNTITNYVIKSNDRSKNSKRVQFRLTKEDIRLTAIENGKNPATTTVISKDDKIIVISAYNNFISEISAACSTCETGCAGKAYRPIFIKKNTNSLLGGQHSQVAGGSDFMQETIMIMDYQILPNGNIKLFVARGANRKVTSDANNNVVYGDSAVDITDGDFAFVGALMPTTDCIGQDLSCVTSIPKIYEYCNTTAEFQDCIVCVNKNFFKNKTQAEHMLFKDKKDILIMNAVNNYHAFWGRLWNHAVFGQKIYAANNQMPLYGPNAPAVGTTAETIPQHFDGILTQFDRFAKTVEIPVESCNYTCGDFALTRIMEELESAGSNSFMAGAAGVASYNDATWVLVGDVKPWKSLLAARNLNVAPVPTTMAGVKENLGMFAATYGADETTFLGEAEMQKNEFLKKVSNAGLEMCTLPLGKYNIRALHDDVLAALEPGVLRLIPLTDIEMFIDSQDDQISSLFGGESMFLQASASDTRLMPSLVSYNTLPTMVNGQIKTMVDHDCGFSLFAYIRFGVNLYPTNISKWLKISLNYVKPNPAYTLGGTQPEFIRGNIYDMPGCGCMGGDQKMMYELDTFFNTEYSDVYLA